ncbi:rhodanese-like domain-containing protein [Zhouia sp. PK063]
MKLFKRNLCIALFFMLLGWNYAKAQAKNDSIVNFEILHPEKFYLIDVRTPEEYKEGHLPEAENINLFASNFLASFDSIAKNDTIYVYCKTGIRGGKAKQKLDSLGYKHVVNLLGGFKAWEEEGKAVVK